MVKWMYIVSGMVVGLYGFSINAYAFSPEETKGRELFQVCNACHNPSLDPPLAPPMWGVQRRYKRMSNNKGQFINLVSEFAQAPTLENAKFRRAVEMLGLMPPVALPEDSLKKIAAYIFAEQFPPPCMHWKIGVSKAEQAGDMAHANKDRKMLKRFCSQELK